MILQKRCTYEKVDIVHELTTCTKNDKICAEGDDMHKLPFEYNYDDIDILKALNKANSKLGELNGIINTIPNPNIILNAVILGEAKESSEIENIVTTFDEVFKEITLKNQLFYFSHLLFIFLL